MAILFLTAWPLAFFWQVALGQRVFYGDDISSIFLPLRVELTRALAEGRLPLWSSYVESGFPIFAEDHIAAAPDSGSPAAHRPRPIVHGLVSSGLG